MTNIFWQHDVRFNILKGMRAQCSSICSSSPCMMTLWHALRHSSNLITMWNSCFNSSFSLVWQLQNNLIASLSLFVTIANLLVIGKYQPVHLYAIVGRRWRYFERTGGQNVCIDPHPSKAKRTNFAGVGEVYTLLRTRHLSFHRSFCDYQKISIQVILTSHDRYCHSQTPSPYAHIPKVNITWWILLFTLFDPARHVFGNEHVTKKSDLMRLVVTIPLIPMCLC